MNIGELSERTGVSRDALRLYERQNLIQSVRRSNGYRDFDPTMVRLVGLIRQGQKLGFTLAEMAEITRTMADTSMSVEDTEALLRRKIADVDTRIAELVRMKGILTETLETVCPLRASAKQQAK